ncbi:MAG: hypothetical protein KA419_04300 [Acidobacteria bacterium]|nr:hypothetical protein [Acidobacteriota bacterium]
MGKIKKVFDNLLLWKYERGTLAYDLMVILILAFVFLTPDGCFPKPVRSPSPASRATVVQPVPAPAAPQVK